MAATLGMMLGGAIANAFAFVGANKLFSTYDTRQAQLEKIRHDKALEKYTRDHNAWIEGRQKKIDYANALVSKERNADHLFYTAEEAIENYEKIYKEPVLEDYYQPSESQQDYERWFVVMGVLAGGGLAYYIF